MSVSTPRRAFRVVAGVFQTAGGALACFGYAEATFHLPMRLPATILLLALVLAASACRNVSVVSASYATLQEARDAGAVSSGYLPEGLPPGTQEIREAHDPQSGRRWALFNFPPAEHDHLRALLEPQEIALGGQFSDAPARLEWWPVLLRNGLDAERIRLTGLSVYKGRGGDLLYAVNWNQGRAYLWTPGK